MSRPGPSTAQKLGLFREDVRKHFAQLRGLRGGTAPMPSADMFTGHAKTLATEIIEQEKRKHELIIKNL